MDKYSVGGAQDGFDNRSLDCMSQWMVEISKDGHPEAQQEIDRGRFLSRGPEGAASTPGMGGRKHAVGRVSFVG